MDLFFAYYYMFLEKWDASETTQKTRTHCITIVVQKHWNIQQNGVVPLLHHMSL